MVISLEIGINELAPDDYSRLALDVDFNPIGIVLIIRSQIVVVTRPEIRYVLIRGLPKSLVFGKWLPFRYGSGRSYIPFEL